MSALLVVVFLMALGRLVHGPPILPERARKPTLRERARVAEPERPRARRAAPAVEDDDELGLFDDEGSE